MRLQKQYFFECRCTACVNEESLDEQLSVVDSFLRPTIQRVDSIQNDLNVEGDDNSDITNKKLLLGSVDGSKKGLDENPLSSSCCISLDNQIVCEQKSLGNKDKDGLLKRLIKNPPSLKGAVLCLCGSPAYPVVDVTKIKNSFPDPASSFKNSFNHFECDIDLNFPFKYFLCLSCSSRLLCCEKERRTFFERVIEIKKDVDKFVGYMKEGDGKVNRIEYILKAPAFFEGQLKRLSGEEEKEEEGRKKKEMDGKEGKKEEEEEEKDVKEEKQGGCYPALHPFHYILFQIKTLFVTVLENVGFRNAGYLFRRCQTEALICLSLYFIFLYVNVH
jgi:hypothetical protein